MGEFIYVFLAALLALAVILSDDTVLRLFYLLAAAALGGVWWSRRALRSVEARRRFSRRAFFGETIPVRLELRNHSWLPLPWLQWNESVPQALRNPASLQRVAALGPHGRLEVDYSLEGRRRGYYAIGPLTCLSGDILGMLGAQQALHAADYLTVYPRIIPLRQIPLPSSSPLGTLRHRQPIFEDPSRVRGKRDYAPGDSLRRVDWKASARQGQLQVRLYEPSIALEAAIFLDLHASAYDIRYRYDNVEFAVSLAASLAHWLVERRQAVGLYTNGVDASTGLPAPPAIPPRPGRGHLMRMLEALARLECGEGRSLIEMLRRESLNLSWGTTLLVISPHVADGLFDELFQARRRGLNVFLLQAGRGEARPALQRQAEALGIACFAVQDELDLTPWRM